MSDFNFSSLPELSRALRRTSSSLIFYVAMEVGALWEVMIYTPSDKVFRGCSLSSSMIDLLILRRCQVFMPSFYVVYDLAYPNTHP